MIVFLNTIITLFIILIAKENLIKELDLLKECKQILVEQNDTLRANLAMKISQNKELQLILIELTNKTGSK